MDTSGSNRRLRALLTAISSKALIPQPNFQRRLVWSNKDKISFLRTVLEGFPFPEIYIAAGDVDPLTGEGTELLVDGQQRLTTLYQYFRGDPDLKLPSDIEPYKELNEDIQRAFLNYNVVVRDLGDKPLGEIKEIFQRINSTSYGLNAMEIHNARYDGEFKEFADKMAENHFFEQYRIFTTTDIKRMNDTRFCLSLMVTIMSTYFTRDKEIEAYLERYNEVFPNAEILEAQISKVFTSIDKLGLEKNSRAFKKADFYTLFVEVHRSVCKSEQEIDYDSLKIKLEKFYSEVDSISTETNQNSDANEYYKAALQASNDRNNRITRGNIIQKIIRQD